MISPLRSQTPDPKTVDIPPVKSSITVTEQIASEVPATITVLDRKEIEEQPGMNLDDRLRAVPGFSLFRRTSSVVANPTTRESLFAVWDRAAPAVRSSCGTASR